MPGWWALDVRAAYWVGRLLSHFPGRSARRVAAVGDEARLIVDLNDPDGLRTYVIGSYEPEVAGFAREVLREGDTVLDVGANIGAHALLFGELVGTTGRVHAFEPGGRPASQLRASIALNGWHDRFTVHEVALSEQIGLASLRYSGVMGNTSSLIVLPWLEDAPQVEVGTSTLDAQVDDLRRPRLMKIDVEGAEQLVLSGGRKRFFPEIAPDYLIVEFWSYGDPAGLHRTLVDLGYSLTSNSAKPPQLASKAPGRASTQLFQDGFEYKNLFFERCTPVGG